MPPPRLFLLNNGLYDQHTHCFAETVAYREAAQRIGIEMVGLANRRIPARMAKLLGVRPVFGFSPGQVGSRDRHSAELADYLDQSAAFAADCRALATEGCGADDQVLVPYALPAEVHGLARWLGDQPANDRPQVMLVFHHPDLRWKSLPDRNSVRGNFSFWRHAFLELAKAALPGRSFLGATVPQLAGVLSRLAESPVHHVPLATWWLADGLAEARRLERRDPDRGADLIVCGDYRTEKGRELVPGVLAKVLAARPSLRVRLQVSQTAMAERVADELRRALGAGTKARVDIRAGQLSQEDFVKRIASSRLALLPYVPVRYAIRSSGVFSEAVGYGVPVVVPRATWMHDCLAGGSGAGVGFGSCTVDDVAAAVLAALDDIDALESRALDRAAVWRAAFNAEVQLRMAGLGSARPAAAANPVC